MGKDITTRISERCSGSIKIFICPLCGGMHPVSTLVDDGKFVVRVKPEPPSICAHCGQEIAVGEWK